MNIFGRLRFFSRFLLDLFVCDWALCNDDSCGTSLSLRVCIDKNDRNRKREIKHTVGTRNPVFGACTVSVISQARIDHQITWAFYLARSEQKRGVISLFKDLKLDSELLLARRKKRKRMITAHAEAIRPRMLTVCSWQTYFLYFHLVRMKWVFVINFGYDPMTHVRTQTRQPQIVCLCILSISYPMVCLFNENRLKRHVRAFVKMKSETNLLLRV